jgi:hypothetical protein
MEYIPPYGSIDPDAPYIDRSTPNAVQGSKIPALAVEHPQREIVAVIEAANLPPSKDDTSQLLKALQFFFTQFPIFPDCKNSNGTFDVTTPSPGTIRIPAGITWVMRGATPYTTVQTDLTTIANKTYHLRWDKAHGFRLRDLADTGYNPTVAAETNAAFDSTYDDILIAKVSTNGSNVATIINLKNKVKLLQQTNRRDVLASQLDWGSLSGSATTLGWARTPDVVYFAMNEWRSNNVGPDGNPTGPSAGQALAVGGRVPTNGATRYGVSALEYYYEDTTLNNGIASWILLAIAL